VPNTGSTRLKRLICRISATTGCGEATTMRLERAAACFAAIIRQRSPALETYSSPDMSSTSAAPSCVHASRCTARSRWKASQLS
jgi:hypothetical protein